MLCFVIQDDRMLLIRKKRGLGAGKVNGPGGRIEPGETALAAASRETQEEIGMTPTGLSAAGELLFQFADGYALHCSVFTAHGAQGILIETKKPRSFLGRDLGHPLQGDGADDEHCPDARESPSAACSASTETAC